VPPLGLLFAFLAACFAGLAYAAVTAGAWVIAFAAVALTAWFAQSAFRILYRNR
jgi:hypothetical protein